MTVALPKQASEVEPDFARLFREHHGLVYRAAYRVTGSASDSEDVLQTVFLRLMRREAGAETVGNVEAYLHRAAVNAALDLIRARQTARSVPLEQTDAGSLRDRSAGPERARVSNEIKELVRDAIARLHPTAARMFVLRYLEGWENADIAKAFATTQATVAVTLHRARARMKKELKHFAERGHET